jgi:hypothetical protein
VPGTIDRTTARSWIRIPAGYVPESLRRHQGLLERWFPSLVGDGDGLVIGPIPAGIPVNLLANLQPLAETPDPAALAAHAARLADLILHLTDDLSKLPPNATDDEARKIFANLVEPMMALSKCPDFVVNRGHYFGTSYGKGEALSDADKRALIEFLKTF